MKFNVEDLVKRDLVKVKEYPNGLKVLKYSREVFFRNLWSEDSRLLDCRGMVVDKDWNIVVYPFTKVFNYGENGTGLELRKDCLYREVDKLNGYLGNFTRTEKYGDLFSTTGTLDSMYAEMFQNMLEEHLMRYQAGYEIPTNFTMMFEVCHPDDPHIVHEETGLYLIGVRNTETGVMEPEENLDTIASILGFKRPKHTLDTLDNILARAEKSDREGVMVQSAWDGSTLFKLKTPHYLTKKLLMRLGKARVEQMFTNPTAFKKNLKDEEFFPFVDYVNEFIGIEMWKSLPEQERRNLIECFFTNQNK